MAIPAIAAGLVKNIAISVVADKISDKIGSGGGGMMSGNPLTALIPDFLKPGGKNGAADAEV